MLLGVIPQEYEDEILIRPEIKTYKEIIEFCKKRTTYKRQKALSELTRRPGGKINALIEQTEDDDKIPTWAMKLFAGKLPNLVPPPPAPHEAQRVRQVPTDDTLAAIREGSPAGRRAFNMKFRFNGCWHCGEKGHSRKPNPAKGIAGCPKFEKLKSQNGGSPPAGYKGAYEKARDAAWEKLQKKRGRKDLYGIQSAVDIFATNALTQAKGATTLKKHKSSA